MTTITPSTTAQHSAAAQELSHRERVDKVLRQITAEEPANNAAPSAEELVEPVKRINETMRRYGVEFELRDENNRVVTRIVDRETGDMIRQIPSEEVLRIAERMDEIAGRLITLEA